MEISTELKVSNYSKFKHYLKNLITEEKTDALLNRIPEDTLMNASFAMNENTGLAYDGSLIKTCLDIAQYAVKINELLPDDNQVGKSSIYKVAMLQHIAKATMYVKNDNDWEVKNRGIRYKFSNSGATLRCGERSVLIAMSAGVLFTEEEFEAMRVIDKINEGDDTVRWYGTTLSMIIRQANEIINNINKVSE